MIQTITISLYSVYLPFLLEKSQALYEKKVRVSLKKFYLQFSGEIKSYQDICIEIPAVR